MRGSAILSIGGAQARPDSSGVSGQGTTPADAAKIDQLEQDIQDLQSQVLDLKRSTADQYSDVQNQQAKGVKVTINNGRPTISNDDFSLSLRALVQYDSAYYAEGKLPTGIDFDSGNNFRPRPLRLRGHRVQGLAVQLHLRFRRLGRRSLDDQHGLYPVQRPGAGALPPRRLPAGESFDDTTSAADLLFLERAQPTDVARGIAGADGRDAFQIFAYDDDYFASVAYTGSVVGQTGFYDEQQAVVGRLAYRPIASENVNFAFGGDFTYVVKLPDSLPGSGTVHNFSLAERPELNVDDQTSAVRLISTGNIDASHVLEWGVEAAGNYYNFYGQGGYFGFEVTRRSPTVLPDPSFNGWYLQASWILTGEVKKYKPDTGSWARRSRPRTSPSTRAASALGKSRRATATSISTTMPVRAARCRPAVSAAATSASGPRASTGIRTR